MLPAEAEAEAERKAWILRRKLDVRAEGAGMALGVWGLRSPASTCYHSPSSLPDPCSVPSPPLGHGNITATHVCACSVCTLVNI